MATTLAGRAPDKGGIFARLRASFDLRYYAAATAITTYGLIVVGGTVRATGSGEACPDWPLCKGNIVPPLEAKVWVEFSHRLLATVVSILVAGLIYAIWRRRKQDPLLWKAAILVGVLLALQIIVGGITVDTQTAAGVVALHLSIALTLLTALIFIAARLFRTEDQPLVRLEVLPCIVLAGVFALVVTGVFVSQKQAGLAYPDWPLFNGAVTPSSSEAGQLHYLHRIVSGGVGLLFLALFVQAVRRHASPKVIWLLTGVGVLFVAQALLGAANVWLELATSVRIAHLALASAVWAVLVFTMAWAYQNGLRLTEGTS